MHATLEKLLAAGPVTTDGAWGTQLQERGLPLGECPEAWNLTHPELVAEVARAYVEAGSQVILSNTFGANRFILARHGLVERVAELNQAGVAISRRAAAGRALVFASMGPSGVMLLMGQTSPEELQAAFAQQAQAMAQAGADGIVVETMSDPAEAALGGNRGPPDRAAGGCLDDVRLGGQAGPHHDGRHAGRRSPAIAGGRGRLRRRQLRPGHPRLRRHLPPAARSGRAARLDQGQRRAARNARRPSLLL